MTLPLSPPSNTGYGRQWAGQKGWLPFWTWRVVWAELRDFCETVSSKHSGAKAPVLIRPLVLKLLIDFHHGRSWASDQFSASTKAKLSHLEAGSVFRDPHSPLTPAANLFPSGGSFFGGGRCRISTQWSRCWWPWRAISYFHQLRLSSGLEAYASLCRAVTLCVYWS